MSHGNTSNSREVIAQLDKIAGLITSPRLAEKVGIMATDTIRDHIYHGSKLKKLSSATVAYRGEGRPLQDTGHLRDSFSYEVQGNSKVVVGTTSKYAPVHNNGATITPKKAKWLCIPARGTRTLERRYGKKPRAVISGLEDAGFRVYVAGHAMMYKGKGKKAKPHVLYYLKKSVVIPKREFFYLTNKEIRQIGEEISNEIL